MASPEKKRIPVPPEGGPSLFSSPEKRNFVLCLVLVVATLALYNPVNHFQFVNFDDDRYVTENAHVQQGLTGDTISWAFTTYDQANWHPLTWLSHALDWQLFHSNPAGHHYVNVLLHAANAVLLFLLLMWATGYAGRSFAVAALFALHPINVESVAWVSERKNVLSMLFFLLALSAYRWYTKQPGIVRYSTVAVLFALGLMAKPQIITLPFVLLLWDYWPLRRWSSDEGGKSFWWLVKEKIPLFALSAASALITMKAQSAGGAVRSVVEYPLSVRLANAVVAYSRYLGKAFWPADLAAMYPHPGESLPAWQVVASFFLLLFVTFAVWTLRQHRHLVVGWLWFLGTLVPMLGIIQVGGQAMADRYAYLPFLGLFLMACWGIAEWARERRIGVTWVAGASVIVVCALGMRAYGQVGYWHDSETLWTHALQVTSGNFVAHDNLGQILTSEGRPDEGVSHFRAAADIRPDDPISHLNIGAYEAGHSNPTGAVKEYELVLQLTSDPQVQGYAHVNLGSAYRMLGDYAHAKESYEAGLRLKPDAALAYIGLGLISQKSEDFRGAAENFSRAVQLQPTDVGYLLLAQALQKSGRQAESQMALEQAKQLAADFTQAQQAVDRMLAQ